MEIELKSSEDPVFGVASEAKVRMLVPPVTFMVIVDWVLVRLSWPAVSELPAVLPMKLSVPPLPTTA